MALSVGEVYTPSGLASLWFVAFALFVSIYFETFVIGYVCNIIDQIDEIGKAQRERMLNVRPLPPFGQGAGTVVGQLPGPDPGARARSHAGPARTPRRCSPTAQPIATPCSTPTPMPMLTPILHAHAQVRLFLRMRRVDRLTTRKVRSRHACASSTPGMCASATHTPRPTSCVQVMTFLDHTWRMHGGTIPDTKELLAQLPRHLQV